jgi:predicted dehydrogenase
MVMIGFDLRFDPGMRRLHELVNSGAVGRVLAVEAVVGQYLPEWRPDQDYHVGVTANAELGGGVLFELCHELDAVSWLVGQVATVCCQTGRVSDLAIDAEDTAGLLLRFVGGEMGTVTLDCVRRPAARTLRVVGARGSAVWDGLERFVNLWTDASGQWQRFDFGQATRDDRLRSEMAYFLECSAHRTEPPADLRTGAEVLRVILAARRSAELGRVVTPSEVGEIPS